MNVHCTSYIRINFLMISTFQLYVYNVCVFLFVAQPLHWVYNHDKMKEILSGGLDPAFSPVSHNPFYTIETGCQSPYGDQMFVQLKCLVKCKGLYISVRICVYA